MLAGKEVRNYLSRYHSRTVPFQAGSHLVFKRPLTPRKGLISSFHQRLKLKGGDPMSSELCQILSDIGCRSRSRGNF
jgi:hypothetical protein